MCVCVYYWWCLLFVLIRQGLRGGSGEGEWTDFDTFFVPFVHSSNGSTVPPTAASTDSLEWIGDPLVHTVRVLPTESKGWPGIWCLLFVLIRQGLRGGSGPQRLIGAPGIETGNPIMTFAVES